MEKSLINLVGLYFALLSFSINSFSQTWDGDSLGLWSNKRIGISSGLLQSFSNDTRLKISTVNDRYGLFIENLTGSTSGLPDPYHDNCAIDPHSPLFGLYVKAPQTTPFHYAAFFEGQVGICDAPLHFYKVIYPQTSSLRWAFEVTPDLDFNISATYQSSPSGNRVVYARDPEGSGIPFSLVEVRYPTTIGFGIKSPVGTTFKVFGDGLISTKKGLDVINQTSPVSIRVKTTESGPNVFFVSNEGQIASSFGLEITSNQDYPIILRNGDSEKVFEVTKEGKIFAREVEVTIDGIPDYVFEEGYNLMNIEDLRIFIEENKHLPNVPSAEDVQKNGLGIGEFQRIQLEKIEELTLYIIQLNEELEKVKRENLILMQKISKLENQ